MKAAATGAHENHRQEKIRQGPPRAGRSMQQHLQEDEDQAEDAVDHTGE